MNNNILKSGTISVFSRDTQVSLALNRQPLKKISHRGAITQFSNKSRNNLVKKARNMEGLQGFNTLTYHLNWEELTGTDCKQHWANLRKRIMRKYPDIYGLWFFEFQKRGAPHFHFITSTPIDNKWLRESWNDIVDPDNEIHRRRGACAQELYKKDAAGAYAAKYTAKDEQKIVPEKFQDVGRFWGTFGLLKKVDKQYFIMGNKAFFDLVRTLRKAYRKRFITINEEQEKKKTGKVYRWKKHGHGIVGFTAWDCSEVIKRYLDHHYHVGLPEFQGNQSELHLILNHSHTQTSLPHTMRMQSLVLDDIHESLLP